MATAKTTKINRAATGPWHGLEQYCRDLNGWPRSWTGLEKDLPPGEQVVTFSAHSWRNWPPESVPKDDPETRR
jgi:hypothetical protein